jgi:hypothetical protein
MPVHALLHLADDIRRAGPVWCYWAFAMERYCGLLANSGKSRRDPFISLSRRIRDIEELKLISLKYNLTDILNLDKTIVDAGRAYSQCSLLHALFNDAAHIPQSDPDILMVHPYRISPVSDPIRRKIAAHLVTNNQGPQNVPVNAMLRFIPAEMPHWGKMKILSRVEIVRTKSNVGSGERGVRDNSFVKVRI